jgi:hypothetical protein
MPWNSCARSDWKFEAQTASVGPHSYTESVSRLPSVRTRLFSIAIKRELTVKGPVFSYNYQEFSRYNRDSIWSQGRPRAVSLL